MTYEPNTKHWEIGDLVIHDADAKQSEMLMRVIAYTPEGLCVTRYAVPNKINGDEILIKMRRKAKVWENDITYLHAPERFGISAMEENDE